MPVNEEDWIAYDVVKCSSFESLFMEFKVPKVDLLHIDFTEPYDSELRARLAAAAERLGLAYSGAATYACTQGPRLETAAEVRRLQQDGCDLVGMTGMPEAALAREAGLAYAAICMVVNPAAGLSSEPITEEAIHAVLEQESHLVAQLIRGYLAG